MATTDKAHSDEFVEQPEQRPPAQPIPPSMDAGFVAPPVDPLGMSLQPAPSTEPVRRDGKQPATRTWYVVFGLVIAVGAGIALWMWLVP